MSTGGIIGDSIGGGVSDIIGMIVGAAAAGAADGVMLDADSNFMLFADDDNAEFS